MQVIQHFKKDNIDVKKDICIREFTSLKIGGYADYFVTATSTKQLQTIIGICKEINLNYFIIGNGSNTLALDYGVDALIIHVADSFDKITLIDEHTIKAEAGALLKDVCLFALEHSLSGMESLYGIPASVGGAVYMNAGAYNGEIRDVVSKVEFIDADNKYRTFNNQESDFAYRHSYYMNHDALVTAAYFRLQKGNKEKIKIQMDDYLNRRETKQPLEWPSAGSTFKRPNNHYASALIDQCDLKGYRINDAMVSEKHAGFLINVGNASSKDFIELVEHIQKTVYAKTGFQLELEVQILK